jgi:uncharacterized protein YgiM (DUF1202 family)
LFIRTVIIIFAALFAVSVSAQSERTIVRSKHDLVVRESPDESSQAVAKVRAGTVFMTRSVKGQWLQVGFKDGKDYKTGWIPIAAVTLLSSDPSGRLR